MAVEEDGPPLWNGAESYKNSEQKEIKKERKDLFRSSMKWKDNRTKQ